MIGNVNKSPDDCFSPIIFFTNSTPSIPTSRRVLITERIPVSEIREIEIVVKQTSGMRWDGKDGFAHFDLDLSPQGQKELLLTYQIEAPSRVQLPPA